MTLSVRNIRKTFGAVEALKDVSLSVADGEVRAICGENGAGKSTLLKILMGIHHQDSGTISLDGEDTAIDSPKVAQDLGIALVSQELSLAPHLSILDNIWLGNRNVPLFHRRRIFRERAKEALQLLGVNLDIDRPVSSLTMGQRQIVEIARLLVKDARVLILDEPTATLSDVEIERMMNALRNLKDKGKSILYVTHRLGEVFDICDTVSVLRNGRDVAESRVSKIDRHRLIELMLGRRFEEMYPDHAPSAVKSASYVVDGLQIPGAVKNFSIVAPRGRITSIAGQVGAGAGAIIRALAGLDPQASGNISLDGKPMKLGSIAERVERNVSFVSEDRAGEGLFRRNVMENLIAARFQDHYRFGFLSWKSISETAAGLCTKVTVDASRLTANAFELSGGNQQKLLFGRAMGSKEPGVLLINEPTRGVDVGARAEIYKLLREFCASGYVVLMTSSDLEEIVGISDAVTTMFRGDVVATYEGKAINTSQILTDIIHPAAAAPMVSA